MQKNKEIMLISGEASGDMHGRNLIKAIQKNSKDKIKFYGMGGTKLKNTDMEILFESEKIAVVGIVEVFSKIFTILKAILMMKKILKERKPDALILIDFPDFNFIIGKYAKKLNIKILYYISPQVWAWRKKRVKTIKKMVNHIAVILPFEKQFYDEYKVPVTYVGHPLLDEINFSEINHQPSTQKTIALLPGSRKSEVNKHLKNMLKAAFLIKKKKNVRFILLLAQSLDYDFVNNIIKENNATEIIEIIKDSKEAFNMCDFVILSSGTATLETAIYLKPMIIIYKVSPISYFIGKHLINVKNIGLVNLIAGKTIVPELIQNDANPKNISQVALDIFFDEKKKNKTIKDLQNLRKILGKSGASEKTSKILHDILASN